MNNRLVFMGFDSSYESSNVVLFGAPMDTTTTNRPGTRFGPNYARMESFGLEMYSPYLDRDLENFKYYDHGDLELTFGNASKQLDEITEYTKTVLSDNKIPFMIGGEHLVSLGTLRALNEKYQDICIIHFDAHCDLRTNYMGEALSHSTVMYHAHNLENVEKIYQFGIRSGTKDEFYYASKYNYIEKFTVNTVSDIVKELKDKNVYISIDLDVLDPAFFSGTGTLEPGGITFKELIDAIKNMDGLTNIIGCDVVELAPTLDSTGVSSAVCAKVIRELSMIIKER